VGPYIFPLIVLALMATAGYFWGRKKNRWIGSWIAHETEAALRPKDTQYVNIGGTIGYHFTYALEAPFKEAKGTFTLLPRQSILYLPLSFLIRRHDRYYLQIYADRALLGEGHILREDYYRKERGQIAGVERMREERVALAGTPYVLLWSERKLEAPLKRFAERSLGGDGQLLHFCCYPRDRNFYLYLSPVREQLEPLLRRVVGELGTLCAAGGDHGSRDAKKD
jgi:hypothetical protein